jgi:hypothetical protein
MSFHSVEGKFAGRVGYTSGRVGGKGAEFMVQLPLS